jgi:hypothetical protein
MVATHQGLKDKDNPAIKRFMNNSGKIGKFD